MVFEPTTSCLRVRSCSRVPQREMKWCSAICTLNDKQYKTKQRLGQEKHEEQRQNWRKRQVAEQRSGWMSFTSARTSTRSTQESPGGGGDRGTSSVSTWTEYLLSTMKSSMTVSTTIVEEWNSRRKFKHTLNYHTDGRISNSDWLVNSFTMTVDENLFYLFFRHQNLTELKQIIFKENHCKNIYEQVRIAYSSGRVYITFSLCLQIWCHFHHMNMWTTNGKKITSCDNVMHFDVFWLNMKYQGMKNFTLVAHMQNSSSILRATDESSMFWRCALSATSKTPQNMLEKSHSLLSPTYWLIAQGSNW